MKKIIFIGQTGSGKTTLCQKLNDQELRYQKTQAVVLTGENIDTPGEFVENPRLYHALIVSAQEACIIGLVTDPTKSYQAIPPGFGRIFQKPVIGIVTKVKQADEKRLRQAEEQLKRAGADPIFLVDTPDGTGIDALREYLNQGVQGGLKWQKSC